MMTDKVLQILIAIQRREWRIVELITAIREEIRANQKQSKDMKL